jgi:mRNA interferase MazF
MTIGGIFMAFQRGDLLLVPFPFSDLSTTKVRPALVVSSAQYHLDEPDLLLGAITSNVLAATGTLDYPIQQWQQAGLKFPSAFKPVLFTLDPQRVIHPIGVLPSADLAEIDKRLKLALNLS